LTPLFVFDGLSIIGQEEMSLRAAKEATLRSEEAWALYCVAKTPERTRDAVTAFGNSGMSTCTNHGHIPMLTGNRRYSIKDPLSLLARDSV